MPAPVYNYQTPQWMNTNPYIPQNYSTAMPNFQQQFNNFAQTFQQQNQGINPQFVVQNMLNNGQMSQQQFNACRVMANQITGMNF